MAPWLVALIFVVVLGGLGWFTDHRARVRRRGLDRMNTEPTGPADPIARVEATRSGAVAEAQAGANGHWNEFNAGM